MLTLTRSLLALSIAASSFAACGGTTDVGPGEKCQSSWTEEYRCPPGYGCDDFRGWTCQPLEPPPSSTAWPDAGPPPRDASTEADADAEDAGAD